MDTINNPYNQQQQMGQPMMPPPMPRQQGRQTWRQRLLGGNNGRPMTKIQERTIPNWIVGKSVVFYFVAMLACWTVYGYVPKLDLILASVISVLLFFYGCSAIAKRLANSKEKVFLHYVYVVGFLIRFLWVLYCYFIFNYDHYGYIYGDDADTGWYMDFAKGIVEWLTNDYKLSNMSTPISFDELRIHYSSSIDDMGYPIWLALIYLVVGVENDVFIPFIIKCIVGAYCAVCIYRVAKRHFGEGTARLAALFVAINPNMIYWCSTMFKEVEMVFLCCLCVDLVDRAFTSDKKLTLKSLLPGLLVGMYIFFFRAPLAIVIFMAMFAHIVMSSSRVMSYGKKIIAGVLVVLVLFVGMGDRLISQTEGLVRRAQSGAQQTSMEWRMERKGGNSFAKYAGATVFAPLIFTIPFPTFNQANEAQILQQQLSGGSYIKNIFSFFVVFVIMALLISGEWRRHLFIIAYTCGYLASLVLSEFAQSGRFHMPVWPMLMLFAAFGIQLAKTDPRIKRWFPLVLVVEVVACLAWNWFKLRGRGMI